MSFTIVQSAHTTDQAGAGTCSATFASAPTAGNLIVVAIYCATTGTVRTVTDDMGNTYAQIVSQEFNGTATISIFYAWNIIVGGTHQVTFSQTSSVNTAIAIFEISGVQSLQNPLDSSQNSSGASGSLTETLTPVAPSTFVFAFGAAISGGGGNIGVGSGFTNALNFTSAGVGVMDAGSGIEGLCEWQTGGVAGSGITVSESNPNNINWGLVSASFRPTGLPTLVQNSSSSSSTTASLTGTVAGNTIIVTAFQRANVTFTFSDGTNTYTTLSAQSNDSLSATLQAAYAFNIAGGSVTITVTSSSGTPLGISISEWSGVSSLDTSQNATGTGNSVDSGGMATNFPVELLIGIETGSAQTTSSPGSGWTSLTSFPAGLTEYQYVYSTGTFNATATLTVGKGGSAHWVAEILSLYLASTTPAHSNFFVMF